MEMIKLDTVSFSLLDLPAIPYEQYIQIYGRSNMSQVKLKFLSIYIDNCVFFLYSSKIVEYNKNTFRNKLLQ